MADPRQALVVGASRGLGLGLTAELRRRGWHVVATVRDEAGERRVRDLAARPGAELRAERLDINDDAAITALRRRLDGEVFDLVIVNAGISPRRGDVASIARDDAAAIFMTNAVSPVRAARAFLDQVREGPGIVAFMSSGLGSVSGKSDSYSDLYSASKAALNLLSRSMAASLGSRQITVLAINPGWVRTDMGGSGAPLSVEDSARGIADVLEARAGTGRHGFVDYRGREVPW